MNLAVSLLVAGLNLQAVGNDPCLQNAFAQLLQRGEGIVGRVEAAAFVIREEDGTFTTLLWPRTNYARSETFRGAIPPGTVAIAHTHPPTMEHPSSGDVAESKRLGIPIYVISYWQIWAVDPVSGEHVNVASRGSWRRAAQRNGCTPKVVELTRQVTSP